MHQTSEIQGAHHMIFLKILLVTQKQQEGAIGHRALLEPSLGSLETLQYDNVSDYGNNNNNLPIYIARIYMQGVKHFRGPKI